MQSKYSQAKALAAITKASFKAILKHPTAIVFSIGFPLIFLWIFGSFGGGGSATYKLALSSKTDTTNNALLDSIKNNELLTVVSYNDSVLLKSDLEKGRIAGIIHVSKYLAGDSNTHYLVHLNTTTASIQDFGSVMQILENVQNKFERQSNPSYISLIKIIPKVEQIREYKSIDFVLPGQLGFSILFSTLFGIAFTFYSLREQLVLKRFYASPINKIYILIGIGFSRLLFQLINVIVLIVVGKYWLGFTLTHGFVTFIQMLVISMLLLFVLMGVGLIFSSIVKQDSTIPLLINLFALPQMLLGGTFFPITVFPSWMQTLCKIFPLTHFNIAIRKISFEGLSLIDCWQNISVISIWLVVVYTLVYKLFRWE